MPTVLDELVVALRLDTSGFTDGQRKALNEFERLKSNVQSSAQTIGTSAASSLHEYLGSIHNELQDVNVALLAMSAQSRRAGESVRAGANAGSDGLKNLAAAAAGAVASVATVHETISGLSSVAGRTAQDVRAAWQTGLDPRFLRAFEQYAFQAGNVDYGTTQSTLAGFEQKRQSYKAQGQYPEEFTQLAFFLGMSPDEAATMPMEQLLTRISERIAKQGTSGPLAQLIASQTAFGSLGYVLGLGPNALHQGVQRNLDTGLDSGQIENLTKLNRAINDFEVGWQNASSAIVASHPEWTKAIENLTNIENWLTKNKEAADTLGTVFEFVAASIIVPSIWKIAQAIIGANASILATPLGRVLFAVGAAGAVGNYLTRDMTKETEAASDPNDPYNNLPYSHVPFTLNWFKRHLHLDAGIGGGAQSAPDNRSFMEKVLPTWLGGKSAPSGGGTGPVDTPGPTSSKDPRGVENALRASALRYGLNPDDVVAVARGEGISASKYATWDVNGMSYGALQMHVGGLADVFHRENPTLDPADPKNEIAMNDWAVKYASIHGWGPWTSVTSGRVRVPRRLASTDFGAHSSVFPSGTKFDSQGRAYNVTMTDQERQNNDASYAYIKAHPTSWLGPDYLARLARLHEANNGGTTNNSTSTGPITVNTSSDQPAAVGAAVQQGVRDAIVTHANTGVSG